jgi:hypothetical protein
MEYQDYPKVMHHPSRQPPRKLVDSIPADPARGRHFAEPEKWEPEKFPAVTVINADDEEYYAAKGYKPAGVSNAAAFSTAHASPYVPGRANAEYPKMVNGVLVQDPNKPKDGPAEYPKWVTPPTGDAVLVNTADEEAKLRASWAPEETKKRKSA